MNKTIGQILFDEIQKARHTEIFKWELCSKEYQSHCESIAQAVLDAQPCPHPWDLVQKTVNVDGSMGWLSKSITAKCTKCGKVL